MGALEDYIAISSRPMGVPAESFAEVGKKAVEATPDFAKSIPAAFLGMPSDVLSMPLAAYTAGFSMGNTQDPTPIMGQLPYGGDDLGRRMGADVESLPFIVGSVGAPDPTDAAPLAAKFLPDILSNPKLMGALAGMTTWHGSPHKFDKFDMSRIGTGEGAQAYGHGLYFAENPKVAGQYQEKMSGYMFAMPDGRAFDPYAEGGLQHRNVRATLDMSNGDLDAAIARADEIIAGGSPVADLARQDKEILEGLKAQGGIARSNGNLYEVDIPDEAIEKMLDWDAPLSEQPEVLKAAASLPWVNDPQSIAHKNGEWLYREIAEGQTQEAASRHLNDLGIPGIRYLDGSSRTAGEGTRNIVVFDDALPQIKSRNGEAVEQALDMSEAARMQRAKDMGFDTERVWYHGTDADFDSFRPTKSGYGEVGGGVYLTSDPEKASSYAFTAGDSSNVLPVHIKSGDVFDYAALSKDPESSFDEIAARLHKIDSSTSVDGYRNQLREVYRETADINELLKLAGFKGAKNASTLTGSSQIVVFDPKDIRSIWADFDPAKADSANLRSSLINTAGLAGIV